MARVSSASASRWVFAAAEWGVWVWCTRNLSPRERSRVSSAASQFWRATLFYSSTSWYVFNITYLTLVGNPQPPYTNQMQDYWDPQMQSGSMETDEQLDRRSDPSHKTEGST